jgi:hypothetical protein
MGVGLLDVTPALEDSRFEPFLAKLLRRPSAGDPGTDHDSVIFLAARCDVYCFVHGTLLFE